MNTDGHGLEGFVKRDKTQGIRVPSFLSVAATAAMLLGAAPALASDEQAALMAKHFGPAHPSEAGIHFAFTPGAWFTRAVGNVEFSPGQRLDIQDDLGLSRNEPTFNAELAIRKHERWELHFGGFHFSTDANGEADLPFTFGSLSLSPGDAFRGELSMTSVSGELRLTGFRPMPKPWEDGNDNSAADGRPVVDLRFMPTFGARWVAVDHRLEHVGVGEERVRGEWAVPYAGLTFELTFHPDFAFTDHVRLEGAFGFGPALGSGGGFAWHVRTGMVWHITENVGVSLGYRLIDLSVKKDDYHFRGGLQGLFAGASIRF